MFLFDMCKQKHEQSEVKSETVAIESVTNISFAPEEVCRVFSWNSCSETSTLCSRSGVAVESFCWEQGTGVCLCGGQQQEAEKIL